MDTVDHQRCRMCFVPGNCHMNIFDVRAIDLKIAQIIAQHFQCEVSETDLLPKFICFMCWSKTESFHEFYQSVKSAQNDYLTQSIKSAIKDEELSNDSNIESEQWPNAQGFVKSSFVECYIDIDESLRKNTENRKIAKDEIATKNEEEYPKTCLNHRAKNETKTLDAKMLHKYFDMTCDMCPAQFQSFQQAQLHYSDEHDGMNGYIKCCKTKFKLKSRVRDHINWHLNPEMYRCHLCNKILSSKITLRLHAQLHAAKENKPFICDMCGKGFPRKPTLRQHILTVHVQTELEFECELCKKRFPIKERLQTHIISVHRSVEKICEFCGKSCKTKKMLQVHLQTHVDNNAKPSVQCEYCGDWLRTSSGIYYHKQLHTSGPQKCTQCDVEVPNRLALLEHVRCHHRVRKHKCDFCEKSYATAYRLKMHVETHTGQGSYQCAYCPMVFKLRNSMRTHRTRTHPDEWKRDQAKSSSAYGLGVEQN